MSLVYIIVEPIVQEFTKSASVVEGDKLRQPCAVYGFPTPTVEWKKRNLLKFNLFDFSWKCNFYLEYEGGSEWKQLEADGHYEFAPNEGVPDATLIINNATDDDRALYMCYAFNELGSANSTVMVRVIGTSIKFKQITTRFNVYSFRQIRSCMAVRWDLRGSYCSMRCYPYLRKSPHQETSRRFRQRATTQLVIFTSNEILWRFSPSLCILENMFQMPRIPNCATASKNLG